MVKIHWSFYLILGAAVLFTSNKVDPQKFKIFIWVAYLFLVIGVAKLAIWFISKKKESPAERKEFGNYAPQQQRAARFCQGCGTQLQGYENFCSGCGQRLK